MFDFIHKELNCANGLVIKIHGYQMLLSIIKEVKKRVHIL